MTSLHFRASRGPVALVLVVSVLVGLAALRPAYADVTPPPPADLDLAKAHYRTGELNYSAGKFADAAREFEEAYRLSAHSELLYNMGKCYDKLGDVRGALVAYRRFMQTVQDSPDRPFVEKRTAELTGLVAHLEIRASVQGATITLDGERLGTTPLDPASREVNPGEHAVEVAAEGYSTYREKVKLDQSQTATVDAKLVSLVKIIRVPEKYVPIYKRWYLWTPIAIVIVAGAVIGGVYGARAANHIDGPSLQIPQVK